MGNYPLLQIYRIMLIIALVLLIGYGAINGQAAIDDFGRGLPEEYLEVYVPLILAAIGLLAVIQLIGLVIETATQQQEHQLKITDQERMLRERLFQLEKANKELTAQVAELVKNSTSG